VSVFNLNERWLLNLLDTIDEGIHAVNLDGLTLVYNQAAAGMDGLRQGDVLGKHVLSIFPSLGQDTSTLMQVLRTGKSMVNRSQTYTNYLGLKVHTVNTTLPIVVAGKVVGAVEIAKDLTQVKNLSEQVLSLQAQVVGGGKGKSKRVRSTTGAKAHYRFIDILTRDPGLQEMKERAALAAKTSSPILVYGETGTGKELLVQAIHNASSRQSNPFLALNCAALPAALLEGILFGTVRGSFTGATDRTGLFELADGGTLFLDEIQSMPLELQAKLLRVLQEGEVLRVGDTRLRQVDVRVIAAMNESPESALNERELRKDLYYRINVVRLDLPPLRERAKDIPVLLEHFIDKLNHRFTARVQGVTDAVQHLFQVYPWPGNVRELENVIEAAMNLTQEGLIDVTLLPRQIREYAEMIQGKSSGHRVHSAHGGESAPNRHGHEPADTLGAPELYKPDELHGVDDKNETTPLLRGGAQNADTLRFLPGTHSASQLSDVLPPWSQQLLSLGMNDFWESVVSQEVARPALTDMTSAFERVVLMHALNSTDGNIKRTAQKLGIPRQTLQYRLKQAGLTQRS
jgi:arginine utilization regulatory protein